MARARNEPHAVSLQSPAVNHYTTLPLHLGFPKESELGLGYSCCLIKIVYELN